MVNKNNKIIFISLYLIISLVFIIPLIINNTYAVTAESSKTKVPGDTQGEVQDLCTGGGMMNTGNSLILSIVTLCLPGVLNKLRQLDEIKCAAVVCKYNSILMTQGTAHCDKIKGYDTCVYVVGEAFALPPMAILDYWINMVEDILKNPMGAAWSVGTMLYRNYITTGCLIMHGPTCHAPATSWAKIPLAVIDIASAVETFKEISENGILPKSPDSKCDEMRDIVKKLKDIKLKLNS